MAGARDRAYGGAMTKPSKFTALALVLVLALAGCGGSDDDELASDAPEPKESIEATADSFAAAIESGDCKKLMVNGVHSTKRPPDVEKTDKPPTKEECEALDRFRSRF